MFGWGEKKRLRKLHNARCRRYYQRHLSKKAREKTIKDERRKQRRKALEQSTKHEDVTKPSDTNDFLL